jgi:hypothetical protein
MFVILNYDEKMRKQYFCVTEWGFSWFAMDLRHVVSTVDVNKLLGTGYLYYLMSSVQISVTMSKSMKFKHNF